MDRVWYVWHGDDKTGPHTSDELRQLKAAGQILPSTFIGRDDKSKREAGRIKGLFTDAELKSAPANLTRPSGEIRPASVTVQRIATTVPVRPSEVEGIVAWSQSAIFTKCEINRWWLGVGVFVCSVSILFLLQVFLLGQSGLLWFIASLVTIGGGMVVHQAMRDSQRIQEIIARREHNLSQAKVIAHLVNHISGADLGFMSLELPQGSCDPEASILTLHPQYLMVNHFEQDGLQLVWANEIERVEPRKQNIGTTSESHSTFSSSSSSSATVYGDYAVGSGYSSGQSHGKAFQEDVYNHKLVLTTNNAAHPLVTLDFLEDEEMWDFSRAALQQMLSGSANYNQAQVRLRSPELNRSISDLRRWFSGDDPSQTWSQMSVPMKMGVVAFGVILLACLGGPIMGFLLGIAVLPAFAITYPFQLAGLGESHAAIAGLAFVLAAAGGFCFIPQLREKLDGMLQRKSMRPVVATAISWPILGQLGFCGLMLAPHTAPPPNRGPQQVQANLAGANVPPKDPIEVKLAENESDWKRLLTPGAGWHAQVTAGTQVSPAHLVVVDAPTDGSEFVFVIESHEDITKRGVFRGSLKRAGMGSDQRMELHAMTDKDIGPGWPLDYLFSTLVLIRDGEKLQGSHGLVVNLVKPMEPALWKKEDVKKALREAFSEGAGWSGYEKPASQSAIEAHLIVTEVKNDGQSVELLATADKSPLAASVFTGHYREDGIGLWGFPLLLSKKRADYGLAQETGSGMFYYGDGNLTVSWRVDGKMVVVSGGVPFVAQNKVKLADFKATPARNLALFSAGSVWQGTCKLGETPAEEVMLTVTEVRNDGAYLRLQLARDAAPHGVEIFVGKLDSERAGYSLTLQRKQAASYLPHCQDLQLRIDPRGKCVGFTDRGAVLELSLAADKSAPAESLSTQKLSAVIRQAFAQPHKYTGTLSKATDGNSAKVAVEFSMKQGAGNLVQAAISIPGGPKGRILFEGSLTATDESVNGYCLMMKKKTAGAAEASSQIFNQRTDVDLWFRLDRDQLRLWGISGDEFLLLEP